MEGTAPLDRLLAQRRRWTRLARRWLPVEADAEELVAAALAKVAAGKPGTGPAGPSDPPSAGQGDPLTCGSGLPTATDLTALDRWFARVLRNAALDTLRRRAAERRSLARLSTEPQDREAPPPGSAPRPCPCAHRQIQTLPPSYAEVLDAVHGAEQPIASFAAQAGLSVNNATVRLHRARRALRDRVLTHCGACAEDGCRDCDCADARQAV